MANISVTDSGYTSGGLDTRTVLDGTSDATFQQMNGAASGVVAIETILGDGPTLKGSAADLVARLAVALQVSGALKSNPTLASLLDLVFSDSRTNTVASPVTIVDTTSGVPAAGIGTGLGFQAESADENPSDVGKLSFGFSDITAASEESFASLWVRVAGAALAELYRFGGTTTNKAIFTHANAVDRTYTLPNRDGIVSIWPLGEVPATGIKTATGSASVFNTSADVTMHDYSFFPGFTTSDVTGGNWGPIPGVADPGDTIGRIRISVNTLYTSSNTATLRWRYLTASDDPVIWAALRADGRFAAVWTADDPIPGDLPGLVVEGLESRRFLAADLAPMLISREAMDYADRRIEDAKLNPSHRLYRAIQRESGDDAPSGWLLDRALYRGGEFRLATEQEKREKIIPVTRIGGPL